MKTLCLAILVLPPCCLHAQDDAPPTATPPPATHIQPAGGLSGTSQHPSGLSTGSVQPPAKTDMDVNHLGSGLAFFYGGKARHNCRVLALDGDTLRFASNDGSFNVPWKELPEDVKKRLKEYEAAATGEATQAKSGKIVEKKAEGLLVSSENGDLFFVYNPAAGNPAEAWTGAVYFAGTFKYAAESGEVSVKAFALEAPMAAAMRKQSR